MRDTLVGWHAVAVARPVTPSTIWGYAVMKQTRGKRQRYSIYTTTSVHGLTYTRLTRDLKREDARGMLRVLIASVNAASND